MTAVRALPERALDRIFAPELAGRARFLEAALASLIAARIALSPFRELSGLPAALFRPPLFLTGLDTIPSTTAIAVLQVVGVVAALAVLGPPGRHRRIGFVVGWLCLLVLAGFRDSRGKIMHNDLLLLWAAVPFLFAAVDLRLRDRRRTRTAWPVGLSVILVALTYFFAGWAKVRRSGPGWAFSDNVEWVLRWGADTAARAPWPEFTRWVADQPVLTTGSAVVTLALELSFPVVIFFARVRPIYALGAVMLHVSTAALLGYDYWLWAAVALVVLVDWPGLADRLRSPAARVEAT